MGKVSEEFVEHAKLLPEITLKLCVHTTTTPQQKKFQMTHSNLVSTLIHVFALSESYASFKAKQTRKQTNKQNTGKQISLLHRFVVCFQ